jgi:GAF domain-containing protein
MDVSLSDVRHALIELGRLRFGEMRVEDAIREIVHTTHSMFDVDGAGLMLADADQRLRNVAASDPRFGHLEDLQLEHQEGPCIDAFETKELVGAEDLARDGRWPVFSEAAVARQVRAVLASPLPYNQDAVGVVAVLSGRSHPWSPEAELALLAFTDLAALLIATMMQGEQQSELAGQLQGALNSRQIIEQAKGVLIGTRGISARTAYEQLRAQARSERRKLAELCSDVVEQASRDPAPSPG